jgi:hypothetical protein
MSKKCIQTGTGWDGWRSHPCRNNAKYGDYCGTHSPEKKAKRAKKRGPTECQLSSERRKAEANNLQALQDALRPFAEAAAELSTSFGVRSVDKYLFTHADLVRAKEVLGDD